MTDFVSFARARGVEIDDLYPSDRIRRCGTVEHPKSKNGAYWYDGERGWVQAWDGDCELYWWDDPSRPEPTEEDRRRWAERRRARELEVERLHGATAVKARALLDSCVVGEHSYFQYKGLHDRRGPVTPDGKLFVPMYNYRSEALVGYQTIAWDGDAMKYVKKMEYGTKARGAALLLGPKNSDEVILCEGYATGLSIQTAVHTLRLPRTAVLVCFSAMNMVHVAGMVPSDARRYIFADNDESGTGEQAAKETGLPYCMASTVGWDANDLHMKSGIFEVCKLISDVRRRALATLSFAP
jgi:phage/plasmid primase-like uncharacterized protein